VPELTIIKRQGKTKKDHRREQDKAKEVKPKTASADTIIANMEALALDAARSRRGPMSWSTSRTTR
jgi:hypothetical protein